MTPDPQLPRPLPTWRFMLLMLRVHGRSAQASLRQVWRKSPLLPFILGTFIIGYIGTGYWLFGEGLEHLSRFPLIGALLRQRIVFLLLGFFFVMLVFSTAIISFTTLFRSRETQWWMTLPVRYVTVWRWKLIEAITVSSWALMFLGGPLVVAWGRHHEVGLDFYFKVALAGVPLVVMAGVAGAALSLGAVRLLAGRGWKTTALAGAALMAGAAVLWLRPAMVAAGTNDALVFDQLLRHTRVLVSPWLPSAWMSRAVLGWCEGLDGQGWFYALLLLANGLVVAVGAFEVVARGFFPVWAHTANVAAARRGAERGPGWLARMLDALLWSPGPSWALAKKDTLLFFRDPAQWSQFAIFFGLLAVYLLNLRSMVVSLQGTSWESFVSYLNLTACALTLSTLTTRFVFPQFSLEGRRLWIVGLAPIGLGRVLWQKFWMSMAVSGVATIGIMIASSAALGLGWVRMVMFLAAVSVMCMTLSGLAVGLGALFPSMKEENPSKIVSGLGGTLCLVASFLYIAVFMSLLAAPELLRLARVPWVPPAWLCIAGAAGWSAALGGVPMFLALRRVKNLEI